MEYLEKERRGDGIGQVPRDLYRPARRGIVSNDRAEIEVKDVRGDDLDVRPGVFLEKRDEPDIFFDSHDPARFFRQRISQGTPACPDFNDQVAGLRVDFTDDFDEHARADQEMLAQDASFPALIVAHPLPAAAGRFVDFSSNCNYIIRFKRVNCEMDQPVLIALPAKDEAKKLGPVLDQIRGYFPGVDILVVDDGSTDETSEVATAHGALVLKHDWNYGYARALQSAREYALGQGYDFLVLCDADGQHEPRDIGKLIDGLVAGKKDFVIASRVLGSAPEDPFLHKYGRRLYSFVVSLLFYWKFRTKITDSSSGFKGWNRRTMEILSRIYTTSDRLHDGRINDLEELFIMAKNGFSVVEVPGRFYKRAEDVSRIYGNYGLSGDKLKIKDLVYVLSWPVLFFRTLVRNIFRSGEKR